MMSISENDIWKVLENVKDPEIPLVSVVDMGIITGVDVSDDDFVKVKMTPTFAGCPAVNVMKSDIEKEILSLNPSGVEVDVNFDVQWNSNMITEKGRQLLKESQFALPSKHDGFVSIEMLTKV